MARTIPCSSQDATGAECAAAATGVCDGGGGGRSGGRGGGGGDQSLCAACGVHMSTANFGTLESLRAGSSSSSTSTERASMMFSW